MNDSKDLKPDEMLDMLESMQAQLEAKHAENYKALKTVSDLSSENSTLRKELQKKSDKIIELNTKLKDQAQIEADLKKSEETMKAGEKAQREAERIRTALEGKKEELDIREADIKQQERELTIEIEKEAEVLTEGLRFNLVADFEQKNNDRDREYKMMERELSNKYRKLTVRYQTEFTIILFYGVIVTALKAIATPEIIGDVIQFLVHWWQALVDFDMSVIGFASTVANLSRFIPNPTVASIVFWVVLVLIAGSAIGIVSLTILSVILTYVRYVKEKQFDRYTVIAVITALAFAICLANVIKGITPINLFALQIGLFLIYSGLRAWIARKKYK